MDAETATRFAAQEAKIAALQARLDELTARKTPGKVLMLKQVAPSLGISVETLRRRILQDPAWQKQAGRWVMRTG
jgi:hypothetical protein